jgi:bla regulator protein BlaR1
MITDSLSPIANHLWQSTLFAGVTGLLTLIFDHLTPEQMKSVLAHEFCHVRRRDNLVGVIQMFVETVLWFHPLVWWIGNRIFQERERACDEEVLRLGSQPRVYAQGILKVCELYLESPVECVAGIAGGANLRTRIDAIMKYEAVVKLNLAKTFALIFAGIAATAVPIVICVWNAPLLRAQALPIPPIPLRGQNLKWRR